MAKQQKNVQNEMVQELVDRSLTNRFGTLSAASVGIVGYFMGLGDTQVQAEAKVKEVSRLIKSDFFLYVLGDTQPLIDDINAIDEVAYPYMDAAAKAFVISILNV